MLDEKKRKFLFRCRECRMIVSIDLEHPEDLEKVVEGEMVLECPCGGARHILRD